MKSAKYLRDARHLNKFIFTLSHPLFYEPLDQWYHPTTEYLDPVKELLEEVPGDWSAERDGFWFHVHPRNGNEAEKPDGPSQFDLPLQGWKVHVSATIWNGESILKRVAKVALANNVPFKFALDRNVLSTLSSKMWPRGGSGKFITLYPWNETVFQNLLEQLYEELHADEGPYILSDKRYKDCRVLYYRYGGIRRNARLDIKGEQVLVLITPDGKTVPDQRTPYFSPPPWVEDPFPTPKSGRKELTLNNGRYLIKKAFAFSNSGGVYLAEDRTTGNEVAIKEARPFTLMDDRGNDAIKLLKREGEILEVIKDTGVAPRPVDSFYEWENFFLVQEYLEGVDIRELMLTRSPLMKVNPSLEDAAEFYDTFKTIFISFAQALNTLHERGIVFGDLSANNLIIDRSTYAVKLIDFEGAFRPGVDEATYLYTPGFKSDSSVRENISTYADDLYSLAASMLYMMFPIGALSSVRRDLFDTVLDILVTDVGWSQTSCADIIRGLANNELTCPQACELLDRPAKITPPGYAAKVERGSCEPIINELGQFILANMRFSKRMSLFPADPFMLQTNPVSFGFGASGVLYALKKCGFEIPQNAFDWLEQKLDATKPNELPPGLLTGSAGIAWAMWELGFEDRAVEFMKRANESPLVKQHHSLLYGMAGIGMANLYLYLRTNNSQYLQTATDLAESLLKTARESSQGIYWENDGLLHLGYGYGQSGIALFFLRLFELTHNEKFLEEGTRALNFDLAHGVEGEPGVISFPRTPGDSTLQPYLEEGTAGIGRVAIRYGMWDRLEPILADAHRKYAGFAGLLYGLGSFISVLTDAYKFSNDEKYLEMAKRPISGIRDIYLIKQPQGSATPGDGLFRLSCDYATGVAGVLRAFYGYTYFDEADFVLDEVTTAFKDRAETQVAQCAVAS
ncbi:MAG TPA: class III lanthionine synthetase LanKC [Pyrinomonadaceae bacterium]|nr:class III lanthionine synthetase LanKC [Pyrinomonadaceae bacterium]